MRENARDAHRRRFVGAKY